MRRAASFLVVILVAGLVGSAPITLARFRDSATSDASFSTGSLAPPTNLAAIGGSSVALTWTPSTTTAAEGYQVLRSATSGSGYAVVSTVTPVGASATVDSPGGGTWYYVLRTYLQNWASADSNEASAIVTSGVTGFQPCAANAADTGGDNDGYEGSPADACITDGLFATDTDTGTNTVNSCTNAGKDRHRFWGYALGLPPTVGSIDGIELQLVAGVDTRGGASRICAELSWDGGTTWTVARTVTLSTNLRAFTLGSATDGWGRAWTPAELDAANLRVRLTDVSNRAPKTFRLDGVSVQVTYTP
jgi:hypothetical protein